MTTLDPTIKDLSLEQLTLLLAMQVFMCDVNVLNFQDLYNQLSSIDSEKYNSADYAIWQPFENYEYANIIKEIDCEHNHLLETLTFYENSNSK